MSERRTGTVTRVFADKGFAFVDASIFIHQNACRDKALPRVGDTVSFVVEQRPQGPSAIDVKVINE